MNVRLGIAVLFFFLILPAAARAERITLFDVVARVNQEGALAVTETIKYDFGQRIGRHGIFRNLQYRFADANGLRTTDITNLAVTNEDGDPWRYEVSDEGGYLKLKIGDPDIEVQGVQTFIISYEVKNAVFFRKDLDEIYWRVTGDDWPVPITRVRARLTAAIPNATIARGSCYAGPYGTFAPCQAASISDNKKSYEVLHEGLRAREGVAFAVALPKGFIERPSWKEQWRAWLLAYGPLALPLLALLWVGVFLWRTGGRGRAGRAGGLLVREPPEGLSPAEAACVWEGALTPSALAAEMLWLADRGYITIHAVARRKMICTAVDYLCEKVREPDAALHETGALVMEAIFQERHAVSERRHTGEVRGVLLSSLAGRFASEWSELKTLLAEIMEEKGFFLNRTQLWRDAYFLGGIAALAAIAVVFYVDGTVSGAVSPYWWPATLSAAALVGAVALWVPRRTARGARARRHLALLKKYMRSAGEKEEVMTPSWWHFLLPYAAALGVAGAWAKRHPLPAAPYPRWWRTMGEKGVLPTAPHDFALVIAVSAADFAARPSKRDGQRKMDKRTNN